MDTSIDSLSDAESNSSWILVNHTMCDGNHTNNKPISNLEQAHRLNEKDLGPSASGHESDSSDGISILGEFDSDQEQNINNNEIPPDDKEYEKEQCKQERTNKVTDITDDQQPNQLNENNSKPAALGHESDTSDGISIISEFDSDQEENTLKQERTDKIIESLEEELNESNAIETLQSSIVERKSTKYLKVPHFLTISIFGAVFAVSSVFILQFINFSNVQDLGSNEYVENPNDVALPKDNSDKMSSDNFDIVEYCAVKHANDDLFQEYNERKCIKAYSKQLKRKNVMNENNKIKKLKLWNNKNKNNVQTNIKIDENAGQTTDIQNSTSIKYNESHKSKYAQNKNDKKHNKRFTNIGTRFNMDKHSEDKATNQFKKNKNKPKTDESDDKIEKVQLSSVENDHISDRQYKKKEKKRHKVIDPTDAIKKHFDKNVKLLKKFDNNFEGENRFKNKFEKDKNDFLTTKYMQAKEQFLTAKETFLKNKERYLRNMAYAKMGKWNNKKTKEKNAPGNHTILKSDTLNRASSVDRKSEQTAAKGKNAENYNTKTKPYMHTYEKPCRKDKFNDRFKNLVPKSHKNKQNNTMTGEWYHKLYNSRSQTRKREHQSDWMFERAEMRNWKRVHSDRPY